VKATNEIQNGTNFVVAESTNFTVIFIFFMLVASDFGM